MNAVARPQPFQHLLETSSRILRLQYFAAGLQGQPEHVMRGKVGVCVLAGFRSGRRLGIWPACRSAGRSGIGNPGKRYSKSFQFKIGKIAKRQCFSRLGSGSEDFAYEVSA